MSELTAHGQQVVAEIAERHGFSKAAVTAMLEALVRGHGSMAQFGHADFGGTGQWMRGGMTMVSDMFDHGMKARVDSLCRELAERVMAETALLPSGRKHCQSQSPGCVGGAVAPVEPARSAPLSEAPIDARLFTERPQPSSDRWWPSEFGPPSSTGSQNGMQYAYFADARRLALDVNGVTSVYDTGDHRFGGFSQQQSSGGGVSFSSQHGTVDLTSLSQLAGPGAGKPPAVPERTPDRAPHHPPGHPPDHPLERPHGASRQQAGPHAGTSDTLAIIEQMSGLHAKGILSDEEFARKKAELLARL